MDISSSTLRGVVHGNVIKLSQPPGLPDGQEVSVVVMPITPAPLAPGEGLRRSFGGWAEDAEELDKYLEWNRQQRKIERGPIEP